jgi:glycosyltransferase involved in cell wall biosynthesis
MADRKRVLVVHYFFPPLGGAGVARVAKFVKYLPEYDWDVRVITCRSTWYGVLDDTFVADIPPSVRVMRARELPIGRLRRRLLNPLHRLGLTKALHYVGWPDEHCGWVPAATVNGLRVMREWRPDVIFSSSYAYSAHFVALAISTATEIPWVADFRDEWANNPFATGRPRLISRLNAAGERAVTAKATKTVVVADWFRLKGGLTVRTVEIPNGVDEDDLLDVPPGRADDRNRFCLSYVGTMYGPQDCAPVLAALTRLVKAGRVDPRLMELRVVGNVWVEGLDERSPVPVVRAGFVDHREALREMRDATALLFYVAASSRAPAGKLYEYLVSGRPILCVARRDNLAYQLVDEWDAGVVAMPNDPDAIDAAILKLYDSWREGTLHIPASVRERTLARFSRRELTGQLSRVLDDAVATRRDGSW